MIPSWAGFTLDDLFAPMPPVLWWIGVVICSLMVTI